MLPGFPTSAIFTFHAFVAPVIRARAGLAAGGSADAIEADVPVRIASELGRKEFVLVALVAGEEGPVAFPTAKGSGAVTSFSQADGFLEIDALASALDAGTRARVTLIGQTAALPDLVVVGSHCIALDVVLGALAERGFSPRARSRSAAWAAWQPPERGECDLAPMHLVDPASGVYNAHLLRAGTCAGEGLAAHAGFRAPDGRCRALPDAAAADALEAALADRRVPDGQSQCRRRNAGAD